MDNHKLFIIIVKYIADLTLIDKHLPAHKKFLDEHYDNGTFLASGPQVPRLGGIILAKSVNRKPLDKILSEDPFHQHFCAEYQVHEFAVNNATNAFKVFLKEVEITSAQFP